MAIQYTIEPSPLRKHFGYLAENTLDVHRVVFSVQNLLVLVKPLIEASQILSRIIRWEFFWTTAVFLFACNVSCLLLPPFYSTLGVLLVLSAIVGIGLSHQKHRVLAKAFPIPQSYEDVIEDPDRHHERVQDFRLLINVMNEYIGWSTDLVLKFYSILKLEDRNFSLKCHAVMFIVVFFLFLFPLRICVVLAIDLLLLRHPIQMRLQAMVPTPTEESPSGGSLSAVPDAAPASSSPPSSPSTNIRSASIQSEDTVSQYSDVQADPGFGTDSDGSERLPDESDSGDEMVPPDVVVPCDASVVQRLDIKPEVNPTRSAGVVGRILDLKKRRQNAKATERCTGCGAVFTTILKRRHICNNCGNHFCSRCCSYKVPRASFGATAPAAQTETVAVCLACFCLLTGIKREKDKTN